MIMRGSTVHTVMSDANLEPFAAHIAIRPKSLLHHVPPTIMPHAGSEKLDAASPH